MDDHGRARDLVAANGTTGGHLGGVGQLEQCGQQQQLRSQRDHGAVAGVGGGNLLVEQRH